MFEMCALGTSLLLEKGKTEGVLHSWAERI